MANDGVLPLLKHGSLRLTRDLLRAEDADDEPWDLLFSVEYEGGVSGGYIERAPAVSDTAPRLPDPSHAISKRGFPFYCINKQTGHRSHVSKFFPFAVASFTQAEVDARQITYVNLGASLTRVRLSVRDGVNASAPLMLTFSAVTIDLRLVRNAPLAVVQGGSQLVRADNLRAEHNLPRLRTIDEGDGAQMEGSDGLGGPGPVASSNTQSSTSTEIAYEVLRGPTLGELQALRDARTELWTRARSFTQNMIDSGQVCSDQYNRLILSF